MPVLPPAPGVTRAVLQFEQDGQLLNNVLHYKTEIANDAPDPIALADRLISWWQLQLRPNVAASVSLKQVLAYQLGPGAPPGTVRTANLPMAGAGASPAMPNNVTLAMSLRTAVRGRSYRGRLYHVGLMESQCLNSRLEASFLSSINSAYGQLLTLAASGAAGPAFLGILSYYNGGVVRPSPVWTQVTSVGTDGILDSQRRRLPGRGR